MSYSGIGASIDKNGNFLNDSVGNINEINFSSNWNGAASEKLLLDLNDSLEKINILNNNLQIYSSALKKVQEMTIIDMMIAELSSQLSGLDDEEDASLIASIMAEIQQLTQQRNSLKSEANSLLSSITSIDISTGTVARDSLYAKLTLDEKKFALAEEKRKQQAEKNEEVKDNLESDKLSSKDPDNKVDKIPETDTNNKADKIPETNTNNKADKIPETNTNNKVDKLPETNTYKNVVSPKNPNYNGEVLTAKMGILWNGPSGSETFCPDQPVGAVKIMMDVHGYSDVELYYRDDGVTLVRGVDPNGERFEDLIAVAADLYDEPSGNLDGMFKRGDIVETSLGTAMVVDMCGRAQNMRAANGAVHFDIYTAWHDENQRWYHEIYGSDK